MERRGVHADILDPRSSRVQKPRDDVDFFFPDTSRSQGGEKTGGAPPPSRLARQDSIDSLFKVTPSSVRSISDTGAGPRAWGSQVPLLPGLLPSYQTKTVQQVCTRMGRRGGKRGCRVRRWWRVGRWWRVREQWIER